ncbi:GGDEF domain-containing protein [Aliiglaciecola sp. LCG003]|uniref:GGDEF domain-containing protein n=1 Tax=Aliiglaciecola sp. LCG003 TaxID=3053655 RepID=UPI002573AAF1|nr:GGDEF domain-containing protein [Aliiglaciecola sp. LCG003]WJG10294.1 GGDEF domain-containing protein [Aliiglaciecola sp. LCG003]
MFDHLSQNLQYRRDVIRVLLMLTFIGGCVFSAINFYRGLYPLAIIELGYGIFSIILWRNILTTANFQRWVMLYLLPFFIIMMYALSVPNASDSIFVWILTIPVISYLLMGRQHGFWVSLFFIVCGIIVYHLRFMSSDLPLNIAVSLNVILSACLMLTLAHVYERNREKNEERLLELAGTDKLTGLANRRKLVDSFPRYGAYAARHHSPLTVVLFDLDFFKKINDQHGHHIGDAALCHVAHFLQHNIRKTDLLARIGGEEFALLMVESDAKSCYQHVESLRQNLISSPFTSHMGQINITVSAGMSFYGDDGTDLEELLVKADRRLYLAKDNGRNCVVATDANVVI